MQQDLNPSCDYKHCRSFFQIKYQEMKWNKFSLPFVQTLFNYEEEIIYINNKGIVKRKTFRLLDQYIFYKNKNDKHIWINYENAIIELISDSTYGSGIRLTKCFDSLEFYCTANKWFKLMKRYAVQYDFHQQYTLSKKSIKIKFGEQFKGKNNKDNLEYNIKVFQKSLLFDEHDRDQFLKEISVTRHLQTDLTIKFYELFENSEQIYVVVENLSSNNLEEYRDKNPFFSEEKAARVIFRIIKIIAYLHSKQIMHRDVKLENFIFRQSDNIDSLCLTDFKLAEFYDQFGDYQFKRCGTVGYVAPEILNDFNYDLKVDVYSVGILLYVLLTGKEPFEGCYSERIIQNALGMVDFRDIKLSAIAMDFLKGVLRIDPLERFSAHEALNHKWFQKEKLINALKFQIKTTLQKPLQPTRINQSFKNIKPLIRDKFAQSFQAPLSYRLKSLPEAPLTERVSLPMIQRRITNILPLHNVLYGKVK